jgi:hypothetical protein
MLSDCNPAIYLFNKNSSFSAPNEEADSGALLIFIYLAPWLVIDTLSKLMMYSKSLSLAGIMHDLGLFFTSMRHARARSTGRVGSAGCDERRAVAYLAGGAHRTESRMGPSVLSSERHAPKAARAMRKRAEQRLVEQFVAQSLTIVLRLPRSTRRRASATAPSNRGCSRRPTSGCACGAHQEPIGHEVERPTLSLRRQHRRPRVPGSLRPPGRRTIRRASRLRNRRLRFTRKPCRRSRTCIRSPWLATY